MTDVKSRGLEIEKILATRGAVEAQVREIMDSAHEDESGLLVPAKTIIFSVSIKHGKRLKQAFERLYPEYQGWLARLVTWQDSTAGKIIRDFEKCSFPMILISAGTAKTGDGFKAQ